MSYTVKIFKALDKPHNKLSTENSGRSPRLLYLDFESNNIVYGETDGYLDGYLDGYSDGYGQTSNYITLFGEDFYGNEIQHTVNINKNGRYIFKDILFSSVSKIEGYLNIKDIYDEPCVLSIGELSPITKRDSELGYTAYVYGESNGDLIISKGT